MLLRRPSSAALRGPSPWSPSFSSTWSSTPLFPQIFKYTVKSFFFPCSLATPSFRALQSTPTCSCGRSAGTNSGTTRPSARIWTRTSTRTKRTKARTINSKTKYPYFLLQAFFVDSNASTAIQNSNFKFKNFFNLYVILAINLNLNFKYKIFQIFLSYVFKDNYFSPTRGEPRPAHPGLAGDRPSARLRLLRRSNVRQDGQLILMPLIGMAGNQHKHQTFRTAMLPRPFGGQRELHRELGLPGDPPPGVLLP